METADINKWKWFTYVFISLTSVFFKTCSYFTDQYKMLCKSRPVLNVYTVSINKIMSMHVNVAAFGLANI